MGTGPSLTATSDVPDKHFFRGSTGAKDVIPLYHDLACAEPNITDGLPEALGTALGIEPPSGEDVVAYSYALLSTTAFQARFAEALRTPGLRVPLTADAELWFEAVDVGRRRLWLQTYAERFRDPAAGRADELPPVDGLGWTVEVGRIPADNTAIRYDPDTHTLHIGDGRVSGVRPDVWAFSVSGMQVVPKWLGYRTAKGAGRAASSTNELDRIRPTAWHDDWNDELLDLLRVLTVTLDEEPALTDLLERVCDGPLIEAGRLPTPTAAERQPPATIPRAPAEDQAADATS